jgi:hypothetical protein
VTNTAIDEARKLFKEGQKAHNELIWIDLDKRVFVLEVDPKFLFELNSYKTCIPERKF